MQSSLYVTLSAQMALQRRVDTIAHNVANATTAGFRAEEVRFETILSDITSEPTAFASMGDTYISRKTGPVSQTDNALDVAVKGEAWLAIETPAGQVYTRDGRMRMTQDGQLQTLNGHAVLDAGGAAIQLNPAGGTPEIATDGTITQNGQRVGVIGLFEIPAEAKLRRHENSGVIPDRPAIPVVEFSTAGLAQGYVEGSNVNPVSEISRLVLVSRAFDAVTASIETSEATFRDALRTLAGE